MFPTLITLAMTVYSELLSCLITLFMIVYNGLLSGFDYTGNDCLQWTFVIVLLHWLCLFTVDFCLGLITLVMTVYIGLLSWFDYNWL